MPNRPYLIAETSWKTVRDTDYDAVVLPWGAFEAHNLHLPYGADDIQSDYVAAESARLAWEAGARVAVLPCVPFGVNSGQLDIKLDINMNPSTQLAVLRDVVHCLSRQGFKKLLVLNGHGGNDFKHMIRELFAESQSMFICTINWWQVVDLEDFFDEPGDHGGEMETSNFLHIDPALMLPLSEAGDGAENKFRLKGLKEGWAWAQREWPKMTKDTGVGNPAKATREKGERFLQAATEKIASFLIELASADISDLYEPDP